MASPGMTLQQKKRIVARTFTVLLIVAAVTVAGAALWVRSAAYAALPQLDGQLQVSGLNAPVTVLRDAHGVPHIRAASMDDLMFAQGYVTAQDRLWQMDASRRYAAGELAPILGTSLVKTDVSQRRLGLWQVADKAAAQLPERERGFLQAYARGVNAYIADHKNALPLEFRILRYFPRAWTVEDTFLVGASMAEMLNHGSYLTELQREYFLGKLGPELANDLYVNSSFRDHPPGADAGEITGEEEQDNEEHTRLSLPKVIGGAAVEQELRPGSNNWVVSGAHTATGKPLLSNDMHLPHQIPNIWYEVHITSGDFDVTGVTTPGIPFVIAGHNARIAWGFTNIGPDVEDVFIETFNDRGEYQTPAGWQKSEHRVETVRVKGGPDVSIDVVTTRHGPIITDDLDHEKRKLALKWAALDPGVMTLPFFEVNSARNWEEFRKAFSQFGGPAQNVVYADVDGHIGYQATGKIPIRASGDGSLPVNGNDDAHEWTGYIPFDKLPSVYDPPSGILATANGRITPDGYPYSISTEWGDPYRTERIYKVLQSGKKFTPADMLALQTDLYSEFDRYCAQRFAYAIDNSKKASDRVKQAADILRKWDGKVTADAVAPSIVSRSRRQLIRMLLEPRVGEHWQDYKWFMSDVFVENLLAQQPARWVPKDFSDYNEFLTAVVEAGVDRKNGAARDLTNWRWGDISKVEVTHLVFGGVWPLRRWASTGARPQSGDGTTVKQVGKNFGPSDRMTVDFADLDGSTMNIVNGQSGNLFSPHFNDQFDDWYRGTTFALPFTQQAVDAATKHRLVLQPESR